MYHDDPTAAHQGANTVYQHISKRYVWETMRKDVMEYVKTCRECQMRGGPKKTPGISLIRANDIFERWGIDIVGPLPVTERGNKYIVVAMDYFTRWPEAIALKSANAITVADFIYESIICRFGAPKIIQSNQETHFVNEIIKELTAKFRIRHSLSSPYHPQSNGLVERFNRTLCEGIAKVAESIFDWDRFIQPVLWAYRTKELKITRQSPYKLVFGLEPKMAQNLVGLDLQNKSILDRLLAITDKVPQLRQSAKRALKENQLKIKEKFGEITPKFEKGDLVLYLDKAKIMRHDTKLEDKWKGPYQVVAVLDKGAYKLALDGVPIKTTVNENLLKKYYHRKDWQPLVVV